jgi:nucleoside-diphosphate-sugar epimerase
LAESGHEVIALIRKPIEAYEGVRQTRLTHLKPLLDLRYEISYGTSEFLSLLNKETFDIFCHHAADVNNYKSPDFDPIEALKNNCGPIGQVLKSLSQTGCCKILLTGSVFEEMEGAGSDHLRAVSPYGLSKSLTATAFKYYCKMENLALGKFVIPNPFGPFEEFRFTSFLIKNWYQGLNAPISMPSYVRDNIHVSLLAKAYRFFAEKLLTTTSFCQINPSGYPESQGAFTERFSKEMKKRLNLPCEYTLANQKEFLEPRVRINTDILDLDFNDTLAWDDLASYYESVYSRA